MQVCFFPEPLQSTGLNKGMQVDLVITPVFDDPTTKEVKTALSSARDRRLPGTGQFAAFDEMLRSEN